MRPEDIHQFVRGRPFHPFHPFHPFRLTLTDGRTYDVNHPELAMVGRSTVTVGIPAEDEAEPIYDRIVTLSLIHIMQVEFVDGASRG